MARLLKTPAQKIAPHPKNPYRSMRCQIQYQVKNEKSPQLRELSCYFMFFGARLCRTRDHSHSIVRTEHNALIYKRKTFNAPIISVTQTVKFAWLLISKEDSTARKISRFQGLSISTGRYLLICNQNRADEVARNYRQNRGETINRASPLCLLQESRTKFVALISVTVETS